MPTDYNYGSHENFKGGFRPLHSTATSSDYLDIDGYNSKLSESTASQSSFLGSHWKKMSSSSHQNVSSIQSGIPTAPRTFSSMSNRSDSTVVSSMTSMKSKDSSSNRTNDIGSSISDSSTINGNPAVSISQLSDSLNQSTEAREQSDCLQLQMDGLLELHPVIKDFANQLEDFVLQQAGILLNTEDNSKEKFKNLGKNIEYVDVSVDETIASYEITAEQFADLPRGVLRKKETIEQFVRKTESFPLNSERVLDKMGDSLRILAAIRQNLNDNKSDTAPLTAFGHEDLRLKAVFDCLVGFVKKLPLDDFERRDFNFAIKKIEKDSTFENRAKCEHIIRHLMTVMSNWEDSNKSTSSSFDTANWNSVGSISSTSDVLKNPSGSNQRFMESSSFALTDDSNLNDLEGALRSSAMRVAVEGPHQVYECSPWNTSSILSGASTEGLSSIHSLNTPMTLSSYVMNSSTCTSLSKNSMPTFEEAHQSLIRSASRSSMKTAFSSSDPILSRPPRSFDEKSLIQSATGTRTPMTNPPSLNFSTVSLSEMVGDVLHTARDAAESPAATLLEALQNSARKCGEIASELMTAVSTSSESLSDTQSSHPSITH